MSEARRKAADRPAARNTGRSGSLGWLAALFFLGIIGGVAAFFIVYQSTEIPDINKEFADQHDTVYVRRRQTTAGFVLRAEPAHGAAVADPQARPGLGDRGRGPDVLDQPGHLAVAVWPGRRGTSPAVSSCRVDRRSPSST